MCVFAFANVSCHGNRVKNVTAKESKTMKRGVNHYNPMGWGAHGVGTYGVPMGPVNGYGYGVPVIQANNPAVPYPVPYDRPVPYPVSYDRPVPYPVHVDRPMPYPIQVTKPLPYPVHVDRPVPYPIQVEKPMPYPVQVDRPYPVQVDRPMPYPVHVPYKVSVPIDRPYPVHVPILNPYPIDRPMPYPVQIPVKPPMAQPTSVYPVYANSQTTPAVQQQALMFQKANNENNFIGSPTYSGGNQDGYMYSPFPPSYSTGVNHALIGLGVAGKKGQNGAGTGNINSMTGNILGNAYNVMTGLMAPGGAISGYANGHNSYLGPKTTGFTTNISK